MDREETQSGIGLVLKENKDDLYNLSVRKKASALCGNILYNMGLLEKCYGLLPECCETAQFSAENREIEKIISYVNKILRLKDCRTAAEPPPPCRKPYFNASKLLAEIIGDTAQLASLVNIRNVERELILSLAVFARQLNYMFDKI